MSQNLDTDPGAIAHNLITVLGPTATGKTKLASILASRFNGEIISADSRQVYRGMDIGTGKDYKDYIVNDIQIKYHLVDITDPSDEYNLFLFKQDFITAFNDITSRKKLPVLAGGSGLYLSGILQNYILLHAPDDKQQEDELMKYSDEELRDLLLSLQPRQHNTTNLVSRERTIKAIIIAKGKSADFLDTSFVNSFTLGIFPGRETVRKRITHRLEQRLSEGMITEVEHLIRNGISKERLLSFGLEYKFIALYLFNELSYDEMFSKLNTAIHAFAKRQMTWFRKMERQGLKIHWLDSPDPEPASKLIQTHLH